MKKAKLLFLSALFLVLSCEEKVDLGKCIDLEIIETSTKQPANVSVFFNLKDCTGKPVAGLSEEDFVIFENNEIISEYEAARRINSVNKKFVYNTILYLDLSGSVLQNESLPSLKDAAISFIDEIMPSTTDPGFGAFRMGIYWFDGAEDTHILIDMTENIAELKKAISTLKSDISADNSTNLYGAILNGCNNSNTYYNYYKDREMISATSLVFFTDGTDRANYHEFTEVKSAIKENSNYTSYYSIGLGGEIDEGVLKIIGEDRFVNVLNLSQLTETFNQLALAIKDEANSYYLLEYCSPKRSGDHTLKITVNAYTGNGTETFNADGFTGGCNLQ